MVILVSPFYVLKPENKLRQYLNSNITVVCRKFKNGAQNHSFWANSFLTLCYVNFDDFGVYLYVFEAQDMIPLC